MNQTTFEEQTIEKLGNIINILNGALNNAYDRENYLQLGIVNAIEKISGLVEDVEERKSKKNKFKVVK